MLRDAVAPAIVDEVRGVVPSKNWTVPVAPAGTVALITSSVPRGAGFIEDVIVTVGVAGATVNVPFANAKV
jgi:hypothetical protein